MKQLIDLLEQPVRAGRRPPDKTVWHCSIRNHATDRTLTDQQWQHIAVEIMAAVGLAPHHDPHAVRWVAVRPATGHRPTPAPTVAGRTPTPAALPHSPGSATVRAAQLTRNQPPLDLHPIAAYR